MEFECGKQWPQPKTYLWPKEALEPPSQRRLVIDIILIVVSAMAALVAKPLHLSWIYSLKSSRVLGDSINWSSAYKITMRTWFWIPGSYLHAGLATVNLLTSHGPVRRRAAPCCSLPRQFNLRTSRSVYHPSSINKQNGNWGRQLDVTSFTFKQTSV